MTCVAASYRARFAAIASTYDTNHLTGLYSDDNSGFYAVLFPDESMAVSGSSSRASDYNSCTFEFKAPLKNAKLHYVELTDDGVCTIDLTLDRDSTLSLKQIG